MRGTGTDQQRIFLNAEMSILCYHSIEPGWQSPLAVPPKAFEEHCAWLNRHRTVIALEDGVEQLGRHQRLPRGKIALTFDDGFVGLYEHAFEILLRYRIPATIFIVAQNISDPTRGVDWVDFPPRHPLRTLSLDQVLEMQRAGLAFGSHTYTHPDLTSLTRDECRHDLSSSKHVLEELLSRPINFLAYPRGLHNRTVRETAKEVGFTHAFSLPETREPVNPHAIPRIGIFHGNGCRTLRIKVSRRYLDLKTSRLFSSLRR